MSNLVNSLKNIPDLIQKIKTLKEHNPKALYGGIITIVLTILIVNMLSSTGSKVKLQPLQPGQTYTLKNPNVGDSLLTSAPGLSSAEYVGDDSINICVAKPGTPAKYLEETVVDLLTYIKVEPLQGECQGKSGWTSRMNVQ